MSRLTHFNLLTDACDLGIFPILKEKSRIQYEQKDMVCTQWV